MNITLLINSIITKVTGRLRSMQLKRLKWEIVSVCPVCASKEFSFYSSQKWYGYKFKLVSCNYCSLVMLSPRLTLESLHEFYLNQYRKEHDYDHKEQMFARGIRRGKYIIDYLGELKIYDAKVIEIGCGYGGILDCFRGKGADIVGVDVDHNVEEFVLSKDIDIYIGTIESFVEERKVEKVDIIILSHVLEHVVDPVGFLQIVRVLLNNKGIIYLEVPGIDNPRVRKNNLGVQPGHLFYFNKKSLLNVCTRAGFEVIKSNNAAQFVLKLLS